MFKTLQEEEIAKRKELLPKNDQIDALASFYKVMGDPSRLAILMALQQGELCAGDLARVADLSPSAASHQLRSLRAAKLVRSRKEGQTVIYALDDDHIFQVLQVACEHVNEDNSES